MFQDSDNFALATSRTRRSLFLIFPDIIRYCVFFPRPSFLLFISSTVKCGYWTVRLHLFSFLLSLLCVCTWVSHPIFFASLPVISFDYFFLMLPWPFSLAFNPFIFLFITFSRISSSPSPSFSPFIHSKPGIATLYFLSFFSSLLRVSTIVRRRVAWFCVSNINNGTCGKLMYSFTVSRASDQYRPA